MSAVTVFYLTTCPCRTFRLWLRSRERGPARWQHHTFVCAAAPFQTSAWTFFFKLAERKCCWAARQWTVSLVNPAPPQHWITVTTSSLLGQTMASCLLAALLHLHVTLHMLLSRQHRSLKTFRHDRETEPRGPAGADDTPSSCVPRDRISDVIRECF